MNENVVPALIEPSDRSPVPIVSPSSEERLYTSSSRSNIMTRITFWQRLNQNIMRGWRRAPSTTILFVVQLAILLIQLFGTATVLIISYGTECDLPLKDFLFIMTWLTMFMLPVTFVEAIWMIPEGQRFYITPRGQWISRFQNTMECVSFIAYLFGNLWFFASKTCSYTSPLVYYTALAWIIYGYVLLFMPLFLCSTVICCLPCVIIFLRRRNGLGSPFGNRQIGLNQSQINTIPVRTYKLEERTASTTNKLYQNEESAILSPLESGQMKNFDDCVDCAICLGCFENNTILRTLPCSHEFHIECIDTWLKVNGSCPLCVRRVVTDGDHRWTMDQV